MSVLLSSPIRVHVSLPRAAAGKTRKQVAPTPRFDRSADHGLANRMAVWDYKHMHGAGSEEEQRPASEMTVHTAANSKCRFTVIVWRIIYRIVFIYTTIDTCYVHSSSTSAVLTREMVGKFGWYNNRCIFVAKIISLDLTFRRNMICYYTITRHNQPKRWQK